MSTDRKTPVYPVRIVLKRTGLTAELLRAWERRYGVVAPARTAGGQRLYSEDDVARLSLLRRATLYGHSIGRLSELPDDEIASFLDDSVQAEPARAGDAAFAPATVRRCLEAVHWMDGAALDSALRRAALVMGPAAFAEHVVAPLVREIGEQWHQGRLRIVQEHLATAIIRQVISGLLAFTAGDASAPIFVAATTSGQHHELGAMMAAAAAAAAGWRVNYLGPDLPGEEIAVAAVRLQARAIGLSLVYPLDAPEIGKDLAAIAAALTTKIPVLVGGGAAANHRPLLNRLGFVYIPDVAGIEAHLAA